MASSTSRTTLRPAYCLKRSMTCSSSLKSSSLLPKRRRKLVNREIEEATTTLHTIDFATVSIASNKAGKNHGCTCHYRTNHIMTAAELT